MSLLPVCHSIIFMSVCVCEQRNVNCINKEDKIMCLTNGAQVVASSVRFTEDLTPSYHSLMTFRTILTFMSYLVQRRMQSCQMI